METTTDSDAQTRAVERDIERTRNEMDATLSELERRLAPSEIVHQGAESVRESVRERARSLATSATEAVKRHPIPVALAVGLVLARLASRPSAEDRLRVQADEDLDRAWRALRRGATLAKDRSLERGAELEGWARDLAIEAGKRATPAWHVVRQSLHDRSEDAWRLLQEAATRTRDASEIVRDGATTRPLATLALLSIAAVLGARGIRSMR